MFDVRLKAGNRLMVPYATENSTTRHDGTRPNACRPFVSAMAAATSPATGHQRRLANVTSHGLGACDWSPWPVPILPISLDCCCFPL